MPGSWASARRVPRHAAPMRRSSMKRMRHVPAPAGGKKTQKGTIHLGYLYAGDPSLSTARKMLTGGLAFRPLVEDLVGTSIADAMTSQDDLFLVHRDFVVEADAMSRYFDAVSELIRSHPDAASYPADVSQARSYALSARELTAVSGSPLIVAGFRVPERSIQTQWLADRFAGAVLAEPYIAFLANTRVLAARTVEAAGPSTVPGRSKQGSTLSSMRFGRDELRSTARLVSRRTPTFPIAIVWRCSFAPISRSSCRMR